MPPPQPDLRLDAFEPADGQIAEAFRHAIEVEQNTLTTLAEHHRADGTNSYHVLHNGAATWGIPGEPQIVALHVRRNLTARTFDFDHATLPLPAMAQSWLIRRGCPPEAIGLLPGTGTAPADEPTRALEQRLVSDAGRFALLHSYTRDDPEDMATVVVLRALDGHSPYPFRVLYEDVDAGSWTHTLREGGFVTLAEAVQWCEDRLGGEAVPLPPVRPAASPTRAAPTPKTSAPCPPGRGR